MTADRACRCAWRIEQDRVEWLSLERRCVGAQDIDRELEPAHIGPQPVKARGGSIDRQNLGAGGRKLGGLATRGGAEIRDTPARLYIQQARWQGGGRVLHPPLTILVAGQVRNRDPL